MEVLRNLLFIINGITIDDISFLVEEGDVFSGIESISLMKAARKKVRWALPSIPMTLPFLSNTGR